MVSRDRLVTAPKPERRRRDLSGFDRGVVEVTIEPAPLRPPAAPGRVVEVVLIAPGEDGHRPL